MIILHAVALLLAVARVTRLITTDYIAAGPRARLINRLGVESKLSYLITCPWCMSVWVATVGELLAWQADTAAWFWIPVYVLAASHAVGLLATVERD